MAATRTTKPRAAKKSAAKKSASSPLDFIKNNQRLLFAGIFALVGVSAILISSAQTALPRYEMKSSLRGVAIQLENVKLEGPARVYDDYRAAGGKGVIMGKAGFTSSTMSSSTMNALSSGCNLNNTSQQLPKATFEVVVPNDVNISTSTEFYVRFKETTALKPYDPNTGTSRSAGVKYYVQVNDAACAASGSFIASGNINRATQNWETVKGAVQTQTVGSGTSSTYYTTANTKIVNGVRFPILDGGAVGTNPTPLSPAEYQAALAYVQQCALANPNGPCPGISINSYEQVGLPATTTVKIKPGVKPGLNKISIYTSGTVDVELDTLVIAENQITGPTDARYKAIFDDAAKLVTVNTPVAPAPAPVQSASLTPTVNYSADYNEGNTKVVNGVRFAVRSDGSLGNPVALNPAEYAAALAYLETLKKQNFGMPGYPPLPSINIPDASVLSGSTSEVQQLSDGGEYEKELADFENDLQEAAKSAKKRNFVQRIGDRISDFFRSLRDLF